MSSNSLIEALRMEVMPDVSVLILALSGQEPWAGALRGWIYEGRLLLSAVVVHEMYLELSYAEIISLGELLHLFPVQVPTKEMYEQAAGIRQGLMQRGIQISLADALIAAQAIVINAGLVSIDPKRYEGIAITLLNV